MKRFIWLLLCVVGLSGCVSLPVQTSGRAGPVSWSATALDQDSVFGLDGETEQFTFLLVLQEMAGVDLALTRIAWQTWQDGVDLGGEKTRTGSWLLPANGTLHQPFTYRIFCPPSTRCPGVGPVTEWKIAFEGNDAQGRPVRFALQATLPWVPPGAVSGSPSNPQTHAPVELPTIHILERRLYYPLFGG